jgi:uncharacterized protein YqgC (DUF456 family)
MSWVQYSALIVTTLIFIIGIVSTLIPVIPGTFITWLGILVHKLWMGDLSVSWKLVIITGILTLLVQVVDFFLGILGARYFGATWKGMVGAFLGALVGFFVPPPLFWLIFGPIIGAILGEFMAGRGLVQGSKAGIGTVVGGIAGFALKMGLSVCIAVSFYFFLFIA